MAETGAWTRQADIGLFFKKAAAVLYLKENFVKFVLPWRDLVLS
jgi:hypothetical protein